jgi:hypothetical protein
VVKLRSNLKNTLKFSSTFLFLSHEKNTSFNTSFNLKIWKNVRPDKKKDKKKEKVRRKEKGKNDRTRPLFHKIMGGGEGFFQ